MRGSVAGRCTAVAAALGLAATLLTGLVRPVFAHNPQLATFALHDASEPCWIEAATAQVAIEAALRAQDPTIDLRALGLRGIEARTLAYFKAHIRLTALPSGVELMPSAGGGVRLGGHETRVRVVFAPAPAGTYALSVRIDALGEDGEQTNLLRLDPPRAGRAQVLLSEAGGYTQIVARSGGDALRLSAACASIDAARAALVGVAVAAPTACAAVGHPGVVDVPPTHHHDGATDGGSGDHGGGRAH